MNVDLYVRCFDSLMSRGHSSRPNKYYVYINHNRTYGEVAGRLNRFKPSVITDRSKAMLLLWFILIVNFRPLSVCL